MGNVCVNTKHLNAKAVDNMGIGGKSSDIDEAALAAIKGGIGDASKAALRQNLQLSFSMENLPNLDTFSKTDAFAVLYELKKQGNRTLKVQKGRTECIYDNLNPEFVTHFEIDYYFEETQTFLVEAYNMVDSNQANDISKHEVIGTVEFQLHQIVTSKDQTVLFPIQNSSRKNSGKLKIVAEEMKQGASESANFKLQGEISDGGNFIFFIVWKQLSPGKYKPVYKSEIKTASRGKQDWSEFKIDTQTLCNCDDEQEIKLDFFRSNTNGNHKLLGSTFTALGELKNGKKELKFKSNLVHVVNFEIKRSVNFLEYVFGGCEINLNIAIDFTLSNGDPRQTDTSLHSSNPQKNEYLQAIKAVGEVLQYYDSDKEIPLYGFGGLVPPTQGRASHCFALNGDIFQPECNTIEGVVQTYQRAIQNCSLYGPTHFSEILSAINGRSEAMEVSQYNQQYQILLIITDGIINDMPKTIDEIVRGSNLPLSIVIVGVGDADFESMDVLDADEEPLYSQKYKKYMSRDIVQFVPFREFRNDPYKLAKETLQEIPGQLVDFFQKRNIYPRPNTEAERQKIKSQLSLRSKKNPDQALDNYTQGLKEQMIQQMTQMGFELFAVQDLIEEKGICENSADLVTQLINKPDYVNPLKFNAMNPVPMYGGAPMGGPPPQQYGTQPQAQLMRQQTMPQGNFGGQPQYMGPPQGQQPFQHQQSMRPGHQAPMMGMPVQTQYQSQNPQDQMQNYGYFNPGQGQ